MKYYVMMVAAMTLGAMQAQASSGFEKSLNTALGNGASVSCNACHNGATNTSTATLPVAVTYKATRDFAQTATADSDGDGYSNKQEVNASLVEFNDINTSPFTKATGKNASVTNIKALADKKAVETAFTDTTGLTTVGTSVVLGDIKVTLNQVDTVFYKAGGIDSTAQVYIVDAAGAGTLVATGDYIAKSDGSITIVNPPSGGFPRDYVIVVPKATAVALSGADASVTGCLLGSATTPLAMLIGLLGMGLILRRRQA